MLPGAAGPAAGVTVPLSEWTAPGPMGGSTPARAQPERGEPAPAPDPAAQAILRTRALPASRHAGQRPFHPLAPGPPLRARGVPAETGSPGTEVTNARLVLAQYPRLHAVLPRDRGHPALAGAHAA